MQSKQSQSSEISVAVVSLQSRTGARALIQKAFQDLFKVPAHVDVQWYFGLQEARNARNQKADILLVDFWVIDNNANESKKSREEKVTETMLEFLQVFRPDSLLILTLESRSSARALANKSMREALKSALPDGQIAFRVNSLRLPSCLALSLSRLYPSVENIRQEYVIALCGSTAYFIEHAIELVCKKVLKAPMPVSVVQYLELKDIPEEKKANLLIFDYRRLQPTQSAFVGQAGQLLDPDQVWVVDESRESLQQPWIADALKTSLGEGVFTQRIELSSFEISLAELLFRRFPLQLQDKQEPVIVMGDRKLKEAVTSVFGEVFTPTGFLEPIRVQYKLGVSKKRGMLFFDYPFFTESAKYVLEAIAQLEPRLVWVVDPTARSLSDGRLKESLSEVLPVDSFAISIISESLLESLLPFFAVLSQR